MGLPADSVIVCDVLQTVLTVAIVSTPGDCPVMERIDNALRATLDL